MGRKPKRPGPQNLYQWAQSSIFSLPCLFSQEPSSCKSQPGSHPVSSMSFLTYSFILSLENHSWPSWSSSPLKRKNGLMSDLSFSPVLGNNRWFIITSSMGTSLAHIKFGASQSWGRQTNEVFAKWARRAGEQKCSPTLTARTQVSVLPAAPTPRATAAYPHFISTQGEDRKTLNARVSMSSFSIPALKKAWNPNL